MTTTVDATMLAPCGAMPNNPALPLLHYHRVVPVSGANPASRFEALFEGNGWTGSWRNGIFDYHHFHSNAHEVLGIYTGSVTVQFGGESGVAVTASAGDVIVVPAGVGHKRLTSEGTLGVVGAYPSGQRPDLCRDLTGSAEQYLSTVAKVGVPPRDPVYGGDGPLLVHWGQAPGS